MEQTMERVFFSSKLPKFQEGSSVTFGHFKIAHVPLDFSVVTLMVLHVLPTYAKILRWRCCFKQSGKLIFFIHAQERKGPDQLKGLVKRGLKFFTSWWLTSRLQVVMISRLASSTLKNVSHSQSHFPTWECLSQTSYCLAFSVSLWAFSN